jgi:alkanesulfonate monooxygenase SsuD/methylene tetrahydromethanopterin reductase-like flavin-dependent oxidoreductase (luciferase family)
MKELWTSPNPSYDGQWTSFHDVIFEPRPAQRPHPPIWVGGWGRHAMRRAVELGDGMYPSNAGPLGLMIADKDRVAQMLGDAGRADDSFAFGHAIDYGSQAEFPHLAKAISGRSARERVPLIFGFDPLPVLDHLGRAAEAGFSHIGVRLPGADDRELRDSMKRFHDEVMMPFQETGLW